MKARINAVYLASLMQNALPFLRKAGFFPEYVKLNESALINSLYARRKAAHKQPGTKMKPLKTVYELMLQDTKKAVDIDLDAGVNQQNKVYMAVLECFAAMSKGHFDPSEIEEVWESEDGPVTVSFTSLGERIVFQPEVDLDWLDGDIFAVINKEMEKVTDERFLLCTGKGEEWFSQKVLYIRLSPAERAVLEKGLGWDFHG